MSINRYDHLLYRVEYPAGYRMELEQLPDWIYITITKEGDSKYLTVHSRIHINKEVKIGPSYSTDFCDRDIIKDLSSQVSSAFL